MKRIFIRLGHDILTNGYCTGAEEKLKEYDVVREYGKALAKELEGHFDVKVFNSKAGTFKSSSEALSAGVREANDWNADIFLSCHANKYNGNAKGTEVFYHSGDKAGLLLAQQFSETISNTLGIYNRGAKDGSSLYEIRKTKMTALLIEAFFLDNDFDVNKYTKTSGQNLGKQLANTLIKYLSEE